MQRYNLNMKWFRNCHIRFEDSTNFLYLCAGLLNKKRDIKTFEAQKLPVALYDKRQ